MSLANLVIKVQSISHIQHVTFENRYLILKKINLHDRNSKS